MSAKSFLPTWIFLLMTVWTVCGCGTSFKHELGSVTKLWIEPETPKLGETVSVHVEVDTSHVLLPGIEGYNYSPRVTYKVDRGELFGASEGSVAAIQGQEISTISRDITWTLPSNPGKATITATFDGQGKSITLNLRD